MSDFLNTESEFVRPDPQLWIALGHFTYVSPDLSGLEHRAWISESRTVCLQRVNQQQMEGSQAEEEVGSCVDLRPVERV